MTDFFTAEVLQFTVHLNRVLLGQMASQLSDLAARQLNFPLDISFLLHSLLHVPSSGVEEDPSMRKTALNRWSRNTAGLPCCYTAFPAESEVKLNLTAASHTPFHLYHLQIVRCARVTMRIMTFMICYAYYCNSVNVIH